MMMHRVIVSFIAVVLLRCSAGKSEAPHTLAGPNTSEGCARPVRKKPIATSETILLQTRAQEPTLTSCCKRCGGKPFCSEASGKCYEWRETDYDFVTCGAASAEGVPVSNESAAPGVVADTDSPCLCVFDIDRTLTGAQDKVPQCPGNKQIIGVPDEAYGSGWLTLSALAVRGISSTFCNQCYIGVSSAGDAGGADSKERIYLLENVLITGMQKEFNKQHPEATEWSSWDTVSSPLALNVPNTEKQYSVEEIRKWYSSKGIFIAHGQVYFFGDRRENIPHFQEFGFNAREISCESRDNKLYGGSGMVGFCGARPEEIIRKQGIHSCSGSCCQKCGEKGFCSSISGNCYKSKAKPYYTTCGISSKGGESLTTGTTDRTYPSCCGKCGEKKFCSPMSGACYDFKNKDYYVSCGTSEEGGESDPIDSPLTAAPACCGNCGDRKFCSPISGNCYDIKQKEYYASCGMSAPGGESAPMDMAATTVNDLYEYLDKLDANGAKAITLNAVYDHGKGYYMDPPSGETNLWCGLAMSDPWEVNEVFASIEEFDKFVATAHGKGMKVMSWLNPSYWWTGSKYFKQAEADIKEYGVYGLPKDSPAHWFRWKEGCSSPYKPPDASPGQNGRGGMEQVWVCDPDVGLSYQSTWARQPLSNFASETFLMKWQTFLEFWIKERHLDGFVFDAPQAYNGIEANGARFRELVTDPIRKLSGNSFLMLSEIYGDLHELVDFGLDGILPGGWDEQFRMWNRLVTGIEWGDMRRVDSSFEYYDGLAQNNEVIGYPGLLWQRQHIDPFGCHKELNTITRATSIAGGYLAAVEEARKDAHDWESTHWWEPDPYTGTVGLNEVARGMEACEAFNHGTRRKRLDVLSPSGGKQYALYRYSSSTAALGFAAFNFEGSDVTVKVSLPDIFVGLQAWNCVTNENVTTLSNTVEIRLPPYGFQMFSAK